MNKLQVLHFWPKKWNLTSYSISCRKGDLVLRILMNHKVIKGKRVARVGRIVEELERMKFLQIYLFDKKQKFTH